MLDCGVQRSNETNIGSCFAGIPSLIDRFMGWHSVNMFYGRCFKCTEFASFQNVNISSCICMYFLQSLIAEVAARSICILA